MRQRLLHSLLSWRKSWRAKWERWRHGFCADDLLAALRCCGVSEGDFVMVHSALDRFGAFKGTPTDVIDVLKRAVGQAGAIMMPTIPFTRTAVEYVSAGAMFDVQRTPSRVGLLTELFRRSGGVLRSLHPTHPVAVWGRDAAELVEGHAGAETPCGPGTPYAKLLDHDGKIAFLGVPIDVLTFFHTIEALLERDMPFSPFTQQVYEVRCRDGSGHEAVVRTRLFEPSVSRRRTMAPLVPELRRNGAWRESRAGNLTVIVIPARATLEAAQRLAARGVYCYERDE